MVCAHCGTLNANDGVHCTQCGRPLAATTEDMCAVHPDRRAVARCCQCEKPLCEECEVPVGGSPFCAEHAAALEDPAAQGLLWASPAVDTQAHPTASFGQRLQAGLIDLVLLCVYWLILYMLLWALIGVPPTNSADAGGWKVFFWLLAILGPFGYLVYENASGGRTLGKAATDVIAVCEDGTLMDPGTAALRSVLSMVGFALGGISYWAILWDPDRRALHDRWTGTVVVRD